MSNVQGGCPPFVQGLSTMTSSAISFTVASAAVACLVDQKTIRRRLDQLEQHGATKSDDGQWAIPLSALLAVGLTPGKPAGPDMSMDNEDMSNGHVQAMSTPVQAELENLRHRLAVIETERDGLRDLVAAERRHNEVLALALRALAAAPAHVVPTTTTSTSEPPAPPSWVVEEQWPANPPTTPASWHSPTPPLPEYTAGQGTQTTTAYGGYNPSGSVAATPQPEVYIPKSLRRRWWQRG